MSESVLLSESLVRTSEESNLRDPFAMAQAKFAETNQSAPKPEVLSESKMNLMPEAQPEEFVSFRDTGLPKAMQKIGLSDKGIPLNEVGKMQMLGRAKQKFGEGFMTNPQFMEVLKLFDAELKAGKKQDIQPSLAGADRTLKMLLGG
jgi:hypothetical protein